MLNVSCDQDPSSPEEPDDQPWTSGRHRRRLQLSHPRVPHRRGLSCPVLSCPVLSCPVLSCPVLSCPVLSCPVLSCSSCPLSCPAFLKMRHFFFLSSIEEFKVDQCCGTGTVGTVTRCLCETGTAISYCSGSRIVIEWNHKRSHRHR
jgi:hypothetical protein